MILQLWKSVIWKEYRVLRPIWLSMLAITVLMQLLVLVSFGLSQKEVPTGNDPVTWLFGVALTMTAMYALGCTAALFSAEREEGTHEFLKLRAVSPRKLIAQKAGFGLFSTALLMIILCGAAFLLAGRLPNPEAKDHLWNIIGLAILELFAWGTLFSLLLKQPLRAAILAVTAAATSVQLLPDVYTASFSEDGFFYHYLRVLPERVCILLVLIAANIWLAGHWFDRPWFAKSLLPGVRRSNRARRSSLIEHLQLPTRGSMFGRLLWQQWHQSRGTTIAIGVGALILMVLLVPNTRAISGIAWPFSLLCATLFGACTFLPDKQQQGYRFLVTHAVSPHLVWLSRQCVGLGYAILVSVLLLAITTVVALSGIVVTDSRTTDVAPHSLLLGLCGVLLVFATGQLCSLLFRGALLAAFFGLVFAATLIGWALLMDAIDAAWWWSVAPLPVAFWVATWLRTSGWLLERNGWRSWLPTALTVAVPILAILIAVPCYRVYQIPWREPGFSVSEFSPPITPEEKATADMYRRAGELIQPMPKSDGPDAYEEEETDEPELWQPSRLTRKEMEWAEQNQPAIELVLEASAREACVFDDPYSCPVYQVSFDRGYDLAWLLACSARTLQAEGKLDEAFDRYLAILRLANHSRHRARQWMWWGAYDIERKAYLNLPSWAAAEGQTSDRIRSAIAEVEHVVAAEPSVTDAFRFEYILTNRLLTADLDTLGNSQLNQSDQRALIFLKYLSPWELTRAQRLLNLLTSDALTALESEKPAELDEPRTGESSDSRYSRKYDPWMRSTFLAGGTDLYVLAMDAGYPINGMEYHTALRRATLILMALAGWYHDHGTLPESIDELVGPYFDELPLDPYTGKPFHYRPKGFPTPIRFNSPNKPIPAAWPLIWSPGADQAQLALVGEDEAGNTIYEVQRTADGFIQEPTEYMHYGLAFPLPALHSTRNATSRR